VVDTLVPDVALLAGMTAITAALDWRLTIVVLGIIPLYVLIARLRNRALRPAQRQARDRAGDLAAFAADLLARLPAVHVFDRGRDEARRYGELAGSAAQAEVAAVDAGARFIPVTDTLPGVGLAAALVAGTAEVAAGRLTLGGFLVFLAYLSSLTGPVRSLARLSATVARGGASRDRIAELLRLPPLRPQPQSLAPKPQSPPQPLSLASRSLLLGSRDRGPEITLERVSYAHRPGQQVLAEATMRVAGGTLVCLTGPSGCGKSTLLSLLVRLADPQEGTITIDGRDITRIPLHHLRALASLVPQDPWLHTGTIAENIGYGRPGATRAQILSAAERAGVAAFAEELPDAYDTQVGAHGRQLSGGQQRRVAVARALLRDTPVLLLDEPTTGLDPSTESRLIADLLAVTAGKTVILVSHQPALITRAENVLRMEAGRITPAEPADTRGLATASRLV
jgi:ABC-type multidrug transport system fused ATPase/permease subunit